MVAEVPIAPGAPLDGGSVADANTPGQAMVIGMHAHLEPRPHWAPPGPHRIGAGDRLIVVATRAGLADVVDRSAVPSVAAG